MIPSLIFPIRLIIDCAALSLKFAFPTFGDATFYNYLVFVVEVFGNCIVCL